MNIEQIKRNIRYGKVNNEKVNNDNISVNVNKVENIIKDKVKPIDTYNEEKHIKRFVQPHEEEEKKPNSKEWEDEGFILDVNKSIETVINNLELDDDVYDWRRETKKGIQSRKNFTNFLIENLK